MPDIKRIREAVGKMVANNETTDYIDDFLRSQGVDAEEVRQGALRSSTNFNPVAEMEFKGQKKPSIEPALQAIEQGATYGWGRRLNAGFDALTDYAGQKLAEGLGVASPDMIPADSKYNDTGVAREATLSDYYNRNLADEEQIAKDFRKANPVASAGLEMAGAIASGRGAPAITGTLGRKMLVGAGRAGIEGALYGAGNTEQGGDMLGNALSGGGVGAAIGGAMPAVSEVLTSLLGKTTGAGQQSVKQAFEAGQRGSANYRNALAGADDIYSVVDDLDDLLKTKQSQASADYLAGMGQMAEKKVSIQPILDKIDDVEKEFNYHGLDKAGEGQRKVLDDVKKYVDMIKNKPDAQTIAGLDSIKQKIGNISTGSDRPADQLKTRLYDVVKSAISDVDPQYGKVMKGYETARNTINTAQKELSAGKNPFTTLRKLQGMMRNDANSALGARTRALQDLGDTTQIMDKLAGTALSSWLPRGIESYLGAGVGGLGLKTIGALSPTAAGALFASMSPRLVGNLAYGAGALSKYAPSQNAVINAILSQATQD